MIPSVGFFELLVRAHFWKREFFLHPLFYLPGTVEKSS